MWVYGVFFPVWRGKRKTPGAKDKTVNSYRGKTQDWKRAALQSSGMVLAAHSMQPLSSLCDPSNVALALAAALRLCSLSHRSWSSPMVFCAGITFTTWFYLFQTQASFTACCTCCALAREGITRVGKAGSYAGADQESRLFCYHACLFPRMCEL